MEENTKSQSVNINLDKKSINILKDIDSTFRDTVVNIGLRMVENTELYKTLVGKTSSSDLETMVSLDSLDNQSSQTKKNVEKSVEKTEAPKKSTNWGDF